jgi:hypothetical protein
MKEFFVSLMEEPISYEFEWFLKHIENFSSSHFAICSTNKTLPTSTILFKVSNLAPLALSTQDFVLRHFQKILTSIKNNKNITSLEMSFSELPQEFFETYIEFFKDLSNIKSLMIYIPQSFI